MSDDECAFSGFGLWVCCIGLWVVGCQALFVHSSGAACVQKALPPSA